MNEINPAKGWDIMTPEDERIGFEAEAPQGEPVDEAVAVEGDPGGQPPEEKDSASKNVYFWAKDLVTCLVAVIFVFIFLVRIIGVDGSSMVPTLHNADMVLLLSNVFYTEPDYGDIVVIKKDSYYEPIVKRVIATEGQTIDIDFASNEVWVDGVLLDEPYINEPTAVQGDTQLPLTVPEGCVFVMGDNRNNSTDSRFSIIGIVDERSILGKVLFRIYPFSDMGKIQ